MEKCPVCSMDVDSNTTKYKIEKDKCMYYFCTKACYDYFLEENNLKAPEGMDKK